MGKFAAVIGGVRRQYTVRYLYISRERKRRMVWKGSIWGPFYRWNVKKENICVICRWIIVWILIDFNGGLNACQVSSRNYGWEIIRHPTFWPLYDVTLFEPFKQPLSGHSNKNICVEWAYNHWHIIYSVRLLWKWSKKSTVNLLVKLEVTYPLILYTN